MESEIAHYVILFILTYKLYLYNILNKIIRQTITEFLVNDRF